MDSRIGLWIDHRQAFIVSLNAEGEATLRSVASNIEKRVRASGGSRSATPYGPQDILAGDRIDRRYDNHLEKYYKEVARSLRGAESVFIMGPGEAKGELRKFLEKSIRGNVPAVAIEATDKMTEAQIIERVRSHFLPAKKRTSA